MSVGSETLKSTLMVAIRHQGIERSGGTRLVEYSSESIETPRRSCHPPVKAG
jgi:hypothetical protein